MADEFVPSVVAVVVSSDPGPWLEECLASLVAQDYPSLSILVIDGASEEPIAPRVASVAPTIFLHRLSENRGFGPSANAVSDVVQGATFYLFCHDDVEPAVDAVSRLVEEAFRSNAGIVGPKLVDHDEPDLILQLGLGVDRFGSPVRRVRRKEFDQAQHDSAREVFAVPGACTLVRTDLFDAIGGFDPKISMFGEDVDMCWRARLVGARIVVAPQASVAHLESTSARRRPLPEARALQWRHELRAVLKNYGSTRRVFIVSQMVVLSLGEMIFFAILGKRRRARAVIDAWRWNLDRSQALRAARAAVMEKRRVPDRVVCRYFGHQSSRARRFLGAGFEAAIMRSRRARDVYVGVPGARPRPHRERRPRYVTTIAIFVTIILLFGARALLAGHLPLIGQFLPFPAPEHFLARFFGGIEDAGTQRPGPSSPAFAILGVAGLVTLGGMGLLLKIGLVAMVVLGAFGVARIIRPFAPAPARLAAGIAYVFCPLYWDDLSRGDLGALVAYAGVPFIVLRCVRAQRLAPFRDGEVPGIMDRRTAGEILGCGILLALLGAFVPGIVLLAIAIAIFFVIAGLFSGTLRASLRGLAVISGGALVAFVLCMPWSITFVQRGVRWSVLSGAASLPVRNPDIGALLRMDIGPIGAGLLGYAFVLAGLFVLVVGRSERFTWGARFWVMAMGALGLSFLASRGWLGSGGGALGVMLAPLACGLAVLIGLGVATVFMDLSRQQFGVRHVAVIAFGIASFAGVLPVLGATLPGRFSVPSTGYDAVLSFTSGKGQTGSSQRVMWLGDPRALPLVAWQIAPGFAFGISSGGLPNAMRLWPSANPGAAVRLASDVMMAEHGLTVRLGALLAPSGIRYLVVPTALAPVLNGEQSALADPPPTLLLDGLAAQSDLRELPAEGGTLVFENTAWHPGETIPGAIAGPGGTPSALRVAGVCLEVACWAFLGGYFFLRRRRRGKAQHARRPPPGAVSDAPAPESVHVGAEKGSPLDELVAVSNAGDTSP